VLEDGSRCNWFEDSTITACAWIASLSGILFAARSLTYAQPVVDLRALGNRNFSRGAFFPLSPASVFFRRSI
jgi:DHA2 family multidrug resistance protein